MTQTTTEAIRGFQGQNRFLSNFHPAPLVVELEIGGHTLEAQAPTAEHAYQASKAVTVHDARAVLRCATPAEAKRAGRKIPQRPDWEQVKIAIMRRIVNAKFRQNPPLATKLRQTGEAQLLEENDWGDIFWGVCRGRGQNHLGRILMDVRNGLAA